MHSISGAEADSAVKVLVKIANFLLGGLFTKWGQASQIRHRLTALQRRIQYIVIANSYSVELHQLREFLIEFNLVKRPEFGRFFAKWLNDPCVVQGLPVLNPAFNSVRHDMHAELDALRLGKIAAVIHLYQHG